VHCLLGIPAERVVINRNWSLDELDNAVLRIFSMQPLGQTGFKYARAEKSRRLHILQPTSVMDIISMVGKGKVVIVPRRDLLLPEVHSCQMEQWNICNILRHITVYIV